MAVDWTLARLRKFVRALRGDRLSTDDVLVLAGRREPFKGLRLVRAPAG